MAKEGERGVPNFRAFHMSLGRSRYDSEFQMFIEPPHEPDLGRLRFLRWLGERGQLEHEVAGLSVGTYAQVLREQRSSQDQPPNSVFLNKLATDS